MIRYVLTQCFRHFNSNLIPKPESFLNEEFGFYCCFNENLNKSVPLFVGVLNEIKKNNHRVQLLGYAKS